ncbi:uncharacterized protein LOC125780091 [Bactrocera dorsalis]|uniref:Uncharacterized protein LOC125780091 n=1 Tax=Bactrocera dorsalis TaxID=27457 RepID=A0ABM3K7Y5_BACDO|nr:uncharacterized protein LOC125780091 [Bactrocera dorsalis]
MYLAISTRPDIAYAANFMSQFNSNYTEEHWKSAKRILRYVKGTVQQGLLYKKTGADLYGVVDADWGANSTDRRSYSGFAFIYAGSSISWEARKQRTVSLSSTESEYIAITEAAKEALSLKGALKEVGIECTSVKLFNDNQSAQKLAVSSNFHPRTKHIDVRHHFIRDCVRDKAITLEYMSTLKMPADILTKGLTELKHSNCSSSLGLTECNQEEE